MAQPFSCHLQWVFPIWSGFTQSLSRLFVRCLEMLANIFHFRICPFDTDMPAVFDWHAHFVQKTSCVLLYSVRIIGIRTYISLGISLTKNRFTLQQLSLAAADTAAGSTSSKAHFILIFVQYKWAFMYTCAPHSTQHTIEPATAMTKIHLLEQRPLAIVFCVKRSVQFASSTFNFYFKSKEKPKIFLNKIFSIQFWRSNSEFSLWIISMKCVKFSAKG